MIRKKLYAMNNIYKYIISIVLLIGLFGQDSLARRKTSIEDSLFVYNNYNKREYRIKMRDGITLFTAVYSPKDTKNKYPFLMFRTPYSCSPYGENQFKDKPAPTMKYVKDKFIFVFQDVRGKFMSEGEFINMRPQQPDGKGIDESTDTYDTIDWLVKNVENNNGKVGIWGISYPGFYAAAASINAHPALVAVSPQAPIADWFFDDFHHHGAFFLPHSFGFLSIFSQPRHGLTKEWGERFKYPTPDGYRFFLEEVGPLKNVNKKYFHDTIAYWNEMVAHPNYDEFWQASNLLPHLKNIKPAVLTVGGWFDAEDLYGPLNIYASIEKNSPEATNTIVMGPWRHGGWVRSDGTKLGNVFFSKDPTPSTFYQENIEFPFFNYYLKGKGKLELPEAYMYETGTNEWRQFEQWPPKEVEQKKIYLHQDRKLSFSAPLESSQQFDEFLSDPEHPVPFSEVITNGMTIEYMTDDQRFASRRPDVLVYQTDILNEDITFAGSLTANLKVSTTGSDADWIVKLIDVYPDDFENFEHNPQRIKMAGYQQMVRSEVLRGRFRNSYEKPEPFEPNKITDVSVPLQDVLHTFKKGHRVMIQIQSTWFPLIDRNPQKYVDNIFLANEEDFIKATHKVYYSNKNNSHVTFGLLK